MSIYNSFENNEMNNLGNLAGLSEKETCLRGRVAE